MALAVLLGQEYAILEDRDRHSPLEDTGRRWPLAGTRSWWEEPRGFDRSGDLFVAPAALLEPAREVGAAGVYDALRSTAERRLSLRKPIATISVKIRRSRDSAGPDWAGNAVDINDGGMAFVFLPELPHGTRVFLSFKLDEAEFSRVPAEIVRQENAGVSAVRFFDWSEEDRFELLSYLLKTASRSEAR